MSKLFLRLERQMLFEQVVVVDGMMMTDVSKFGVASAHKLEDDSIGSVNPKAPDFVMFGM